MCVCVNLSIYWCRSVNVREQRVSILFFFLSYFLQTLHRSISIGVKYTIIHTHTCTYTIETIQASLTAASNEQWEPPLKLLHVLHLKLYFTHRALIFIKCVWRRLDVFFYFIAHHISIVMLYRNECILMNDTRPHITLYYDSLLLYDCMCVCCLNFFCSTAIYELLQGKMLYRNVLRKNERR